MRHSLNPISQRINGRRGVTLAEVAMSTLLVGTIMIASLNSLGMVQRTWGVTASQGSGVSLAQDLLEEMNGTAYWDPEFPNKFLGLNNGEGNTNRLDFDDIDDYDDWSASPPQSRDGTEFSDFTGWTRSVDVKKVTHSDLLVELDDNAPDDGIRKLTVTVTSPTGETTTLVVFRSRWGAVEQSPPHDATVVTGVSVELQTSGMTRSQTDGVSLPNHVEDTP